MTRTHAAEFARLDHRLHGLRVRAQQGPLTAPLLESLQHTAAALTAMIPQLARYVAALEDSRGLALEDARALLARVRALDLDAAMVVVRELRRAGRIRGAVRAYLLLLRRAPRDATFADRLAGFALLLEEYAVRPEAGMARTLSRSLPDGWWRDPGAREAVDETLTGFAEIDWDGLPA